MFALNRPLVDVTPLDSAVRVIWGPPPPGLPVTRFEVTPVFGRMALQERSVKVDPSETTAVVRGLVNDVTYTVQVIPWIADEAGPPGVSQPFAPGVEGNGARQAAARQAGRVAAAPTDVIAVAGEQSATVMWSPPVGDGPLDGYRVVVTPAHAPALEVPVGQTSVLVTGLRNSSRYSFTVVAVSRAGEDTSSPSNSIRVGSRRWRRLFRRPARVRQPTRLAAKTIPYDKSVRWYLVTVVVVTFPIALNWIVLTVAKQDATPWTLIGRGELLLIGVPVAVLALAGLHTREVTRAAEIAGARAVLTVALGLLLAAQVALYGAVTIANLAKDGANQAFFLGVCYGLYVPTVMVGAAGVWVTQSRKPLSDSLRSRP